MLFLVRFALLMSEVAIVRSSLRIALWCYWLSGAVNHQSAVTLFLSVSVICLFLDPLFLSVSLFFFRFARTARTVRYTVGVE